VCQRSLGYVRGVCPSYRNLRCVRGVWDLSEICFCVIGIQGESEELGICQRSVSVL
jgi:hypothetical protein